MTLEMISYFKDDLIFAPEFNFHIFCFRDLRNAQSPFLFFIFYRTLNALPKTPYANLP